MSGVVAREWEFRVSRWDNGDFRYWEYEKGDFSIRLDTEAGPFEQILLAAALRAGADMADRSGASAAAQALPARVSQRRELSGASLSGASLSGASLSGASLSNASLTRPLEPRQEFDDGARLVRRLRRASPPAARHARGGGRQII